MHYMPWYETPAGRGHWGTHWAGPRGDHHPDQKNADGLPDLWSHYHPLIGPYDSNDPAVQECQLLQMKLAGIDGVMVDWYGISPVADYPPIQQATCTLFASCGSILMKFAICFEDRTLQLEVDRHYITAAQIPAEITKTVTWMAANWFNRPQYYRLNGRPLLLDWGPTFDLDPRVWSDALSTLPDRPAYFALHHLWRKAQADGGFTWIHAEPFAGNPDAATAIRRLTDVFEKTSADPNKLLVSAFPGFNDIYDKTLMHIDPQDGRVLSESLQASMSGPWQTIQLATWNDYGEGTIIEPTYECGYRYLEIVQAARRQEIGDQFTFSPDDLRLPQRLLELRRAGAVPTRSLDAIAQLLRDGRCGEARQAMTNIGG